MAGIGFELRSLLRRESLWGLLRAYGYAGLISSGPWVLSILGVMGIGMLSVAHMPGVEVKRFLVSVTYLMAASLVLTGLLQLMLTRFVADRLFEKDEDAVLPNLFGALTVTSAVAGTAAAALVAFTFRGAPVVYRLLIVCGFVTMCDLWLVVVLLSGLKAYSSVLRAFAVGYAASVAGALGLRRHGLEGLLAGFVAGQALLLFLLLSAIARRYPVRGSLVSFAFLGRRSFPSLALTGLCYNLAIWTDKIVFWTNPLTSDAVIGPLRASLIYDIPVFLAYLSIVPGMAVFLVRVETDFAEHYDAFFRAVRQGDTLGNLTRLRQRLALAVRRGFGDIFKVQGLTLLVWVLAAPRLLAALRISPLYLQLFNIDLVGVGTQVLLLAVFNVLFYLDERATALGLSAGFALLNFALTVATQRLGPAFYGYGFALSTAATSLFGLAVVTRKLDRLECDTFMRQGLA